jgi:hypothetical protein
MKLRHGAIGPLTLTLVGLVAAGGGVDAVTHPGIAPAVSPSAVAAAATCPDRARREPDPQRPRYRVEVAIDPASPRVTAAMTVVFTPDLETDRIVLRLWPNGGVRSSRAARATISQLTVDGAPVTSTQPDPTTVVVALGRTLRAGEPSTIAAGFEVIVAGETDERWSRSAGSMRLGSFVPVLAWEPGVGWNQTPATVARGEASMNPVASYEVRVRAPASMTVLGTGTPSRDGDTWSFTADAVRDVAYSVGRFRLDATVISDVGPTPVTVTIGVADGLTEPASLYRRRVVQSFRSLAQRYGPAPFPWYALAITPGLRGGIEYPGHVMQGPGSSGRSTPHEVAHQWFYALVGNDQGRDPWIDEGLATWAEARVEGTVSSFTTKDIPSDGAGRAAAPMSYWSNHQRAYYRSVYVQTLQALASLGNPDAVDCALRRLAEQQAHAVATVEDVLRVLDAEIPGASTRVRRFLSAR